MSAFILTDKHFSAIAYAIMPHNAQSFANKLKAINTDSVNYRHGEKTRKTRVKLDVQAKGYNPSIICKLIACWDYQSCENAGSIDYLTMKAYLYEWASSAKNGRDYDETAGIGIWII